MTYMNLDDAITIVLHDMAKGDCSTEPSELVKKARSIFDSHVDALFAVHAPPKHWAVQRAEGIILIDYPDNQKYIKRVARALVDAREDGLNEAHNIVDSLKRKGYGDKRAIDALDHAMQDIDRALIQLRRDAERT